MITLNVLTQITLNVPPLDPDFNEKHAIKVWEPDPTSINAALTSKFSIASGMTPARNQGPLGTCATFGIISCLEYFIKRDLSEACLTHEVEQSAGDCQAGGTLGEYIVGAKDFGVVEEQYWSYDAAQICWGNQPDVSSRPRFNFNDIWALYQRSNLLVVQNMTANLISNFGGTTTSTIPASDSFLNDPVALIKSAMTQLRIPIAISVPVFFKDSSRLDAGWETGVIKMPTPANLVDWIELSNQNLSGADGWHVIAICGFDDDTQRFEFKNSWAPYWGKRGFGTIPYEYVRVYSREAFAGTV